MAQCDFWFRKILLAGVGRMEGRSGQEPRGPGLGGYYHHREVVRPEPRQPRTEKMEVSGLSEKSEQQDLSPLTTPVSLKSLLEIFVCRWKKKNQYVNKRQAQTLKYLILNEGKIQENRIRRKTQVSMMNRRSQKD